MRSSSSVSLDDEGGVVFEAVFTDLIESDEDWREEDVEEGRLMLPLEGLLLNEAGSRGGESDPVAIEMLLPLPVSGFDGTGLAIELWPLISSEDGVLWCTNAMMDLQVLL